MFGYKTPGTVVAEIKMHRETHSRAVLAVEGKDDLRFWRAQSDGNCELVDGEGKSNVLGALPRLDACGVKGVLGLIDSDYDIFLKKTLPSRNLVATDAHDLECVLVRSKALDGLLAEFADESKIKRFEDAHRTTVREALLDRTLYFGLVRLAATLWDASEVMRELRVPRFVDETTWTVDADTLIRAVAERSGRSRRTWQDRTSALRQEDPWFVARGHDMLEILRIGLRNVLGDISAGAGVKDIARGLRMAMSREYLEATGLWNRIRSWEDENPPFQVLRH